MGRHSSSRTESVWSLLQALQLPHFSAPTLSLNYINKSISYSVAIWHMLCSSFNHVHLLAPHHARSRPNLNQRNHTRFCMEQHMSDLTKKQFFPRTRVTGAPRMPLCLTAIITGLLLSMMSLLTGCGGGTGSDPSVTVTPGSGGGGSTPPVGATASLAWSPVPDSSVIAYFVHYGRVSPGTPGSCTYESSMYVASPSATVTNLEPNTLYYFTVSAYNGLESACSSEVSTVTPSASV